MTTTAAARSSGSRGSGCGCGGGGGCAGGCGGGCGGAGRAPVRGTSFVRPRFFGGMLLTESDLQAVDDYVLAKRRLTNRSVLGAGVVCGLDVTCDPCGSGSVLVSPGHAIDCCGNDVVVECRETVDVLALVRDLRARQGIDCGQPCAEDEGSLEYVLNLVYTEELAEPVAPYTTDDCAGGDCDYSRVREGYAFELSCDAPPGEASLVDVMRECMGLDREETEKESEQVLEVVRVLAPTDEEPEEEEWVERAQRSELVQAWKKGEPFAVSMEMIPTSDEFAPLAGDEPDLPAVVHVVSRSLAVLAADAAHDAGRGTPGVPINNRRSALLTASMQDVSRRALASGGLQRLSSARRPVVERVLKLAADPHDLDRIDAADLFSLTEHGAFSSDAEDGALAAARRIQNRMLQVMAQAGRGGCRDYDEVAHLRFDQVDAGTRRDAQRLGRAYVGLFQRCLCDAVNPPCPTCTDARIPLARVRVRGCDVVAVCSLERHWVHSPRALAYWFPLVEAVRELLEERCCREEEHKDQDGYDPYDPYEEKEGEKHDEKHEVTREAMAGRAGAGLGVARRTRRRSAVRERELDRLAQMFTEAGRAVEPPEDKPVIRDLMVALGDRIATRRSHDKATAPPPDPSRATTPGVDAAEQQQLRSQVAELSTMVAELRTRLEELEGGTP